MMAKTKRDTYNYNLKNGRKIVYKGTSNDLEKRANEHQSDGKKFTYIQKIGKVKTKAEQIKKKLEIWKFIEK